MEKRMTIYLSGPIMDELQDVVIALEAEAVKATVGARG